MKKALRFLLIAAMTAALSPGLTASATVPDPVTPLWGGGVLADQSYDEIAPVVDSGVAVWAGGDGSAIYYGGLLEGAAAGTLHQGGNSASPDISGGIVVWEERTASDADVWMAEIGVTPPAALTAAVGTEEIDPHIDGGIAVWREGTEAAGYQVAGSVLGDDTAFSVDMSPASVDSVDVSDGLVAFSAAGSVYVYDVAADELSGPLNTGAQADSVSISGGVVVWSDQRAGNRDIFAYDIDASRESTISAEPGAESAPDIHGDVIVWQDDEGGLAPDIQVYDLGRTVRYAVTDDADAQSDPATDGSYIVWTDSRSASVSGLDVWFKGYDTVAPVTTSDVLPSYDGTATISLAATDGPFGSGIDKTWYKVDYQGAWYADPFEVTRPGHHTLHYKSYDKVGNLEEYNVKYFDVVSVDTVYTEIEGDDRYETAVVTSQNAFPKGAQCVVIATGENWPDALGGAALAKAKGASILLTTARALPSYVIDEIERLGATEAIVLGGEGVVSGGVYSALEELLGESNVDRIGGDDRYETADLVARATREAMGYSPYKVLVATGANFPDALGASPLAALGPWPLVLAPPNSGLTEGTKTTIEDIGCGYGVVLGGEGVVSPAVVADLEALFGKGSVQRLAGANRYETSIECAKFGISHGLMWDGVALATGENFPDALAGGILQGRAGSVLLLTPHDSLHPAVASELEKQRDWIGNVTFLGGDAAVSADVRESVADILK